MAPIPIPADKRFWRRVEKLDGENACWLYRGTLNKGYGHFWTREDHAIYAHVFSYRLHYGDIPEGLKVLHRCDVRDCVRPDHLWLGTQSENIQDMLKKGRGNYLSGPDNPMYGMSGDKNPMFGKTRSHSEESKKKMSLSQTGRKHSEETKRKIGEARARAHRRNGG